MTADAPRAWQRMLSGRRIDLLDPSPRVARWNGQTVGEQIFSVAQHSLSAKRSAGSYSGNWLSHRD
jgi:uncharacterized protein